MPITPRAVVSKNFKLYTLMHLYAMNMYISNMENISSIPYVVCIFVMFLKFMSVIPKIFLL